MRKCNDEAYQLAKDWLKSLKNKRLRPFCLLLLLLQVIFIAHYITIQLL